MWAVYYYFPAASILHLDYTVLYFYSRKSAFALNRKSYIKIGYITCNHLSEGLLISPGPWILEYLALFGLDPWFKPGISPGEKAPNRSFVLYRG